MKLVGDEGCSVSPRLLGTPNVIRHPTSSISSFFFFFLPEQTLNFHFIQLLVRCSSNMADMPSNQPPAPRPSPPARSRGRGGNPSSQQEHPETTAGGQFLRPDGYDNSSPRGRGARSASRSGRGSSVGRFTTSREEFSFTDDEEDYTGNSEGRANGNAFGQPVNGELMAEEDEEEEPYDEQDDNENDDYYSILIVPSDVSV